MAAAVVSVYLDATHGAIKLYLIVSIQIYQQELKRTLMLGRLFNQTASTYCRCLTSVQSTFEAAFKSK